MEYPFSHPPTATHTAVGNQPANINNNWQQDLPPSAIGKFDILSIFAIITFATF